MRTPVLENNTCPGPGSIRQLTGIAGSFMAVAIGVVLLASPLSGQRSSGRVDSELVRATVESLAKIVEREYFDAQVAERVGSSLRERLEQGRYAAVPTLESLANMLTSDMFRIASDKHLAVAVVQPSRASEGTRDISRQDRGQRENFGVQRVEILPGNVGYINLTGFYRPEEAGDTIAAAMRTVQFADALILDLRDNGGGSPHTVAVLASYFFNEPGLRLFATVGRSGEACWYTTQQTAAPEGNALRPLYLLTSANTFSAGEGIAFILQERRRAEVIGEPTPGAANPGRSQAVNAKFEVTVPNAKVVTAETGRNWEGSGVSPDIPVPAGDGLKAAHARALSRLIGQTVAGPWRDQLQQQLKAIKASPDDQNDN